MTLLVPLLWSHISVATVIALLQMLLYHIMVISVSASIPNCVQEDPLHC